MNDSNSSSSGMPDARAAQGSQQSEPEHQQGDSQQSEAARSVSARSQPLRRRRARRPAGPPPATATSAPSQSVVWVSADSTDAFSKSGTKGGSSAIAPGGVSQDPDDGVVTRSRRSRVVAVLAMTVAAVVIIAGVTTAAVMGVKEHSLRSQQQQCDRYAAFARQVIVNLTSLNPDNIDQAETNFQKTTSGKALEQSQSLLKQAGGLIKSQKLSTQGVVITSAVDRCDSEATSVLLVSGWHMKNPETKTDDVQTFRWKVEVSTLNGEPRATVVQWVV